MIRPGDTVSLSIHPTIQLSQYTYVKAAATITRQIGSDTEAELEDMRAELRRIYADAVLVELGVFNEVVEIVESGGSLKDLAKWATKRAHGCTQESTTHRIARPSHGAREASNRQEGRPARRTARPRTG